MNYIWNGSNKPLTPVRINKLEDMRQKRTAAILKKYARLLR